MSRGTRRRRAPGDMRDSAAVPHIAARLTGGSNRGIGQGAPLMRATHLFAMGNQGIQ
jgi:hypothetical protein